MPINADKPNLWKPDTRASVDQFNQWFMKFAPKAYRSTRRKTIESVERGLTLTKDLLTITPDVLKANPAILPTLRMSTCPPLARDRLIGLADSTKNLVGRLEQGMLPPQLARADLAAHLKRITAILSQMLDADIFLWLEDKRRPTKEERYRSSTIVADRLCCAVAEPIVRNSQEKRPPAPFLCTYMGRTRDGKQPFRFLWNRSQATAHNVYLMLYPKGPLIAALKDHPELEERVFTALQRIAPSALVSEGRVYGGGLHKVEPKELAHIPAREVLSSIATHVRVERQEKLFA